MQLLALLLALVAFLHPAIALKNTSQEFYLKTSLIPGQTGKSQFNNLYLWPYHTGAGFNDAVLMLKRDPAVKAFLNGSHGALPYHNLVFDLGNDFPWYLDMEINTNFYAAWEPVGIDISYYKPGGFWSELSHRFIDSCRR